MRRIHPVFHVSLLEPYVMNDFPGRIPEPPAPIEVEGQVEYEIEAILNSRQMPSGRIDYKIRWKGYDQNSDSWEPADNVHAEKTLARFHTAYPRKPGRDEFMTRYPEIRLPYINDLESMELFP